MPDTRPATKSWHISYRVDPSSLDYFGESLPFDELVRAVRDSVETALSSKE